jgi:hypothetical protein
MNIVRSILGILGGLILGAIIMSAGQMVIMVFNPPPAGIDPTVLDQFRLYIASWPASAFVILLVVYFLGVFFAAFGAAKIAGRAELLHGFIISLLFSLGAFANFANIPQPTWVMTGAFIVYFVAGFAGASFAANLRSARTAV